MRKNYILKVILLTLFITAISTFNSKVYSSNDGLGNSTYKTASGGAIKDRIPANGLIPTPAPPVQQNSVTTAAATLVTATTVTLNGSATAQSGYSISYYFEYGLTSGSYTTTNLLPIPSSVASGSSTPSYAVTGLTSGTTYYYRIVGCYRQLIAKSTCTTFNGSEQSFITLAVNSAPTDISLSTSAIDENVATNSIVGTLSSTDPNAGNTFTYTLVSGTGSADNASFNISGSNLQITNSPDYETKNSYSIRVRTTDQGGLYYEKAFSISINNINETPSDIALSASAINENVVANSTVGTLSSTDPDAGNTFTYTLVSGPGSADNASFNISGSSLRITNSPDFEVKNSYSMRIRTTDQGTLFYEKAFTITINDVFDAPVVTTQAVSSITSTTATGNGNITSLGVPNPTAYGVCWNTGGTPTTSDSKVDNGAASATGAFTASITSLTANTTYYVKAYATNTAGTSYGTEVTFTTNAVAPTVTTQAVSSIASTTATGNGNITSLGAPNPTQYGVVWSTSTYPTTGLTTKTTQGSISLTGAFTSSMTGLAANTTYYVKAYATNTAGTSYGTEVTFTTTAACTNPSNGGVIANSQAFCGSFNPAAMTSTSLPTGNTGTLQYQWQSSTDNISFTDLAVGTYTATTYDPTTITTSTWYRRQAKVTCESSWVSSNVIKMSVDSTSIAGTLSGLTYTCDGKAAPLITLSGQTGSVLKWQKSSYLDGLWTSFTDIVNTNPTYAPGVISDTMKFRVNVKNGSCAAVYSSAKQLNYRQNPTFTTGSITSPTCYNDSITFVANGLRPSINNIIYYTATFDTSTVHATKSVITDVNGDASFKGSGYAPSSYAFIVDSIYVQGCVTPFTGVVGYFTVNPLPVPTISGNTSACINSTGNVYTTEAGMTGYSWNVSGGTITAGGTSTDNTVTITWNTIGADSLSVNYINFNSCTATSATVYNVTVNPLPVPTISGTSSVCVNSTGKVYTTESGMTGYSWSIVGGTITGGSTTNAATVTWDTSGAKNVNVNYTNSNGCIASIATVKNVSVNSLPVPTISGPTAACINSTGNVYTTQTGMSNYAWDVTGGYITAGINTKSISVTWNTVGAQSLSIDYSTPFTFQAGCSAASPTVYDVTVNPLPVPTISGNTTACINSTGNVYTTETAMTGYTWNLSGGTITAGGTSTDNTVTITWNTIGADSLSVNYTNGNGCTAASATVKNVTVNSLPVPTLNGLAYACVTSTGNSYSTDASMTNYTWNVSGGTIASGSTTNSILITWNTAGAQTVNVNYTNSNGCTASTATVKNVSVNSLPVPTISGPTAACINSTGNVYTTQTGMSNYTWDVTGGTITAGINTKSISVTWNTVGAQSLSIDYSTPFTFQAGCSVASPTVYDVTVNPLPVPTISGNTTACINSTGNVYTTEAGMTAYNWSINGGTITAGSTTNSVTVTWTASGAKSISVNYTNTNSCTATSSTVYNVTVNSLPVPTLNGLTYACVSSTGNNYSTDASMTNYTWNVSGGTIASGSTTNSILITWNTAGAQTVNVNYTNSNGCTASTATLKNVGVNSLPVPTISGPTSACINSTGNVYTTQTGMSHYSWNVTGGTITSGGALTDHTATITWNTSGAESVSVNYANQFTIIAGCSAASPTVYDVTVNPLPVPTISGNTTACINSTGNVYTTETSMTGYTWNITGGTITSGSTPNTINVTWTSLGAQTLSLNYTNTNTCTAVSATEKDITVNQLPVPTISGSSNLCNHTTGNVYTTESGMSSYTWNVTGGTITAGDGTNAITVTWNTEGAQTVSVNYANSNGCTAVSATVYGVTVKSGPNPVITGSPDNNYIVPKLATYQYSTPLVAGNLYSWSSPKIEGYCSASARNCINVHFLDPCCVYGQWTISVTETNPSTGCSTKATKLIYITP